MTNGCSIKLKWEKGKERECDGGLNNKCTSLILKSLDGEQVGVSPSHHYLHNDAGDSVAFRIYEHPQGYLYFRNGEHDVYNIKVNKNDQGEFELSIQRSPSGDIVFSKLEMSDIELGKGIDFEQYIGAESSRIQVRSCGTMKDHECTKGLNIK